MENIPAFIIQNVYINRNRGDDISVVVYATLTFTVLSLTISIISQGSRLCQRFRDRNDKFLSKELLTCRLTITSNELKWYHGCSNKLIENCLLTVLETRKELDGLDYRIDTSYDIQVYDIKSQINYFHQMKILFDVVILSDEYIDRKNSRKKSMQQKIHDNILQIDDKFKDISNSNSTMKKSISTSLGLRNVSDIKLSLIVVNNHIFDLREKGQAVTVCNLLS